MDASVQILIDACKQAAFYRAQPARPIDSAELSGVENRLSLVLPDDLKEIAITFGDFYFSLMPQYALGVTQNGRNIADATVELRHRANLPEKYVCLSQNDDDVVLLESQSASNLKTPVYWLDLSSLGAFAVGEFPGYVYETYPSYSDYFKFVLEREIDIRQNPHIRTG